MLDEQSCAMGSLRAMPDPDAPDELLTPLEAAKRLGITVRTLHRWEAGGFIESVRTPYNHRRFRRSDVEKLLTRNEPKASA